MATHLEYNDNVFINCPYDAAFGKMFEALIFAVYALGFRARAAREIDDAGDDRLNKIMRIIGECRYGIHDLSRAELDPVTNLARFNMPLELGIFLGSRRFGNVDQKKKNVMVLDAEQFRYRLFISDLAGVDPQGHNNEPERAVRLVRDWLRTASRRVLPSANIIAEQYQRFVADLPAIAARGAFDLDAIPYVDFEWIVAEWLTVPV